MSRLDSEPRTRQVQIKQRQSLVDAVRLKARSQSMSANEAMNEAIEAYIQSGGEAINPEKNTRMLLLLPQSTYNRLAELAKAQNVSINRAIEHAMEAFITGKPGDLETTTNRLITYIRMTGMLRSQVDSIVSTVNTACGGIKETLSQLADAADKNLPASKEPERRSKIQACGVDIEKSIDDMCKRVNNLWQQDLDI